MANIMSMKGIKNNAHRNGFDLSRKNAFSAKAGELLPVLTMEVLPGDDIDIKPQWFTRTQPINTAAYTRIREYYDVFFVPNRLLWNKFGQFVTQMDESISASGIVNPNNGILQKQPYFTTASVRALLANWRNAGKENIFGFSRSAQSAKLLDYLGYGNFYSADESAAPAVQFGGINQSLNPFPLLAYQKIYQDFYRYSQWEKSRPDFYNLDYSNGGELPISQLVATTDSMFDLRYSNWQKDMFMGLLPTAQYGDDAEITVSSVGGAIEYRFGRNGSQANADADKGNIAMYNGMIQNQVDGQATQNINQLYLYADNIGKFAVLALRKAEFLQKFKEVAGANRKDYQAQTKAHFNVDSGFLRSDRCEFIDGFESDINIGEVVNTNITGDNESLIAGKGTSAGRGKCTYKAKEHGILMVVYHCQPILDYESFKTSRLNTKIEATDYAIPEMDSIGMEPVPFTELINDDSIAVGAAAELLNNPWLGYAPRYIDYKTAVDEIHGVFRSTERTWLAPLSQEYLREYIQTTFANTQRALSYTFFKVNPNILNPIFGSNASVGGDASIDRDQFLINSFFDVKCVRNLDVNGLPY